MLVFVELFWGTGVRGYQTHRIQVLSLGTLRMENLVARPIQWQKKREKEEAGRCRCCQRVSRKSSRWKLALWPGRIFIPSEGAYQRKTGPDGRKFIERLPRIQNWERNCKDSFNPTEQTTILLKTRINR